MSSIRFLRESDFDDWSPLFEGYCKFYERSFSDDKARTVFSWLIDPEHVYEALVLEEDGKLFGLAHFHAWPDTLDCATNAYLGDLFVDPSARGRGFGKRLFEEVLGVSKSRGYESVTLLTHKSNKVGQNLYNQFGRASDFLFYVADL